MARPKSIPSLRHHIASGRATVRIDGRDHYCGAWDLKKNLPTTESRAVYGRLIADWLAGTDLQPTMHTVGELVAAYWRHVRQYYRKNGRETSEVYSQKVAIKYLLTYADMQITDFGPLRLKAIQTAMVSDGLTRKSINRHIGRIRQVFTWASESEFIDPVHPERLKCVRGLRSGRGGRESKKIKCVEWPTVAAIKPYVSAAVWAMVQLQWHTGMRSGEVIIMTGGNIDMSDDIWIYSPAVFKTQHHEDAERHVAIGPKGQAILRPWLRQNPDEMLFQPRESEIARNAARNEDRVTPHWPSHDPETRRKRRGRGGKRRQPGDHYKRASYWTAINRGILAAAMDAWQKNHGNNSQFSAAYKDFLATTPTAAQKAKWRRKNGGDIAVYTAAFNDFLAGRKWSSHVLRHTFATRAGNFSDSFNKVRSALGHTTAAMTADYVKQDIAAAKALIKNMES